jgi:hypothetical protein
VSSVPQLRYWDLPRSAGVYIIENHETQHSYIGSGVNMMSRGSQHYHALAGMKHTNRLLQAHWDRQIENQFSIRVLEHCLAGDIRDREQYWIDCYLAEGKPLYNRMLRIPDREYKAPEWKGYVEPRKKRKRRGGGRRNWY